jgi:hypothetical protein
VENEKRFGTERTETVLDPFVEKVKGKVTQTTTEENGKKEHFCDR